jgi:hypothetical protein
MQTPHPHNPMPYGVYFIVAFALGTIGAGFVVNLLHSAAMSWPVGARLGLAVSPFIVGAAYGARAFAFGRADKLTLKQALRRAIPGLPAGPGRE